MSSSCRTNMLQAVDLFKKSIESISVTKGTPLGYIQNIIFSIGYKHPSTLELYGPFSVHLCYF